MAHEEQILPAETLVNSAKTEIPISTTGTHFVFLKTLWWREKTKEFSWKWLWKVFLL